MLRKVEPVQAEKGSRGRRGIAVVSNGIQRYMAGCGKWEPLAQRVAPVLGYTMDEIDGRYVGSEPQSIDVSPH
jgi:hypothetical protein